MFNKNDIVGEPKHLGYKIKAGDLWVWEVSSVNDFVKFHKKHATILTDDNEIKFIMSQFPNAQLFDIEEVLKNVTFDYHGYY